MSMPLTRRANDSFPASAAHFFNEHDKSKRGKEQASSSPGQSLKRKHRNTFHGIKYRNSSIRIRFAIQRCSQLTNTYKEKSVSGTSIFGNYNLHDVSLSPLSPSRISIWLWRLVLALPMAFAVARFRCFCFWRLSLCERKGGTHSALNLCYVVFFFRVVRAVCRAKFGS